MQVFAADTDGDGISNHLDMDSDNDGIYDVLEADPTFTGTISAEGRISGGVNADGIPSGANAGNGFTPVDTDADGTLNFMDLNSDGDACPDANEYYNNPSADGDGDSIYGVGTPSVDANGLVVGAGYDGPNLANVIDNTVFLGCEPYIFEGSAGDTGLGGAWGTASNWNFNRLPTAIDTAEVRANTNVTILQQVGELTIDSPFIVSIDTLQTLSIKENLTNNGIVQGYGYLVFDGDAPQQIIGNGLVENSSAGSFSNIRLNNAAGLTLTDDADLLNVLDLDAGTFTIEADNFLTFKSSENQTAVLTEVASGTTVSGCVIVERFIPPTNRSYRYIASAVSTTNCGRQTIQANIQEDQQVTDYTNYPGVSETPGFGTHITGSNAVANGFDATQTGNPSMFSWNVTTQQWNAIPNTNSKQLNTGEAYALMVRGGRELDLNLNNTQLGSATTLRFTGELVTGNFPVVGIAENNLEFSLIANPYQAQVDIETLLIDADVSNINIAHVWIYDPNLGVHGGYAALDMQGPDFDPVPLGSRATKFLQPNQSMFVQNTGNTPALIFKETHKKGSDKEFTNGTFSVDNTGKLDITLRRYHQSDYSLVDGVRLYFEDNFSKAVQGNDALKLWNSGESLAINQAGTYLSIERRNYPEAEESVQLSLFNYSSAAYQFELKAKDVDKTVYLKDKYTGQLQKLEQDAVTKYAFTANKQIPESVSSTRFELRFEAETLGTQDMESEGISLYPNPASELLHIQLPDLNAEKVELQVIDMAGRLVFRERVSPENGILSTRKIEHLGSGVYLVKIKIDTREYTKKIIIE